MCVGARDKKSQRSINIAKNHCALLLCCFIYSSLLLCPPTSTTTNTTTTATTTIIMVNNNKNSQGYETPKKGARTSGAVIDNAPLEPADTPSRNTRSARRNPQPPLESVLPNSASRGNRQAKTTTPAGKRKRGDDEEENDRKPAAKRERNDRSRDANDPSPPSWFLDPDEYAQITHAPVRLGPFQMAPDGSIPTYDVARYRQQLEERRVARAIRDASRVPHETENQDEPGPEVPPVVAAAPEAGGWHAGWGMLPEGSRRCKVCGLFVDISDEACPACGAVEQAPPADENGEASPAEENGDGPPAAEENGEAPPAEENGDAPMGRIGPAGFLFS